jgi:hypothetical protein
MQLLLEQTSVLGCRLLDVLGSGETKQLVQNAKHLAWQGIELAVDPSTTMALAEVAAHLCHALEELDDSFHPTPRAIRNLQNESTYLTPLELREYHAQSIETVILSSLGINRSSTATQDFFGTAMDDGSSVNSVPSNVAFDSSMLGGMEVDMKNSKNSAWVDCKNKVNVELLKERILQSGRPQARSSPVIGNQTVQRFQSNNVTTPPTRNARDNSPNDFPDPSEIGENDMSEPSDVEELVVSTKEGNIGKLNGGSVANRIELLGKMEEMRAKSETEQSAVQEFYRTMDTILQGRRQERSKYDMVNSRTHHSRARIRKLRQGRMESPIRSRKASFDRHSRLRKYPPSLLYIFAGFLAFVATVWIGFGLYGVYTFYQVLHYRGSVPIDFLHPVGGVAVGKQDHTIAAETTIPPSPSTTANEIVIRIVKEVIYVHDDGTEDIENHENGGVKRKSIVTSPRQDTESLPPGDIKELLECIAKQ